jgi:DNA repair protein RadD
MLLKPRDYQDYAIAKPFEYFMGEWLTEGMLEPHKGDGHPLIAMPTGVGKSIVVAGIVERALREYPQTRILMLTETKELVSQNYAKTKELWAEAPIGIYCDGLNRKQHHYPITFGTITSVINIAAVFGFIDLVIVDECHGISEKDDSMYRTLLATLSLVNPKLKVIGLTATPYRMKQGLLTHGENALFTDIVVDMTNLESYNWFFEQGYLVPPIPRPTSLVEYDLSRIKVRGGEYDEKSMQAEVDDQKKNEAVVLELLRYGVDRHSGMVFASGVDHCRHLLDIFEHYGESATWVASRGMTPKERDHNIQAYKEGEFKWMINNGILTTGFDHPPLDIIGMARLTLSPGLWVQMLGRGTRPLYASGFDLGTQAGRLASIAASQKQNTLVLDFAKNVTRLGPINDPRVPTPSERKRTGDAPVRICESCGCYNHASARSCWNCQFEFPRFLKIEDSSSTAALVAEVNSRNPPVTAPIYTEIEVDRMTFSRWTKQGRPDSIKVTYHCGRKFYNEWVCLDHEKQAGAIARRWWREFSGSNEVPPNVDTALGLVDQLRVPRAIEVATNVEFGDIRSHIFD